ncbi:MAG TPA: TIGR00341 family protein [Acidimicrobiia bacterium]
MVTARGQRRTVDELGEELFLDIGDVATKRWKFTILLTLAAVIATAGVLTDSTATVIGAMIVAPLGTPIIGTAFGIVISKLQRVLASAVTVLLGAAAVVAIGWLLAAVLPEVVPQARNSQVTGRTSPGLIDLVAAIATGFVGAYGLARKDVSDVMPGVAIAISLVPPLAVVGITAQAGDLDGAWGAFQLFASNMLAMIVAGSILFTIYGYAREASEEFSRRWAYLAVGVASFLIVVPLTVTTIQTVRRENILDHAKDVAVAWAQGSNTHVVRTDFEGDDLILYVEDLDDLPGGDLASELAGVAPSGTLVIVNRVGGERLDVGTVP